ncbi:unnamed protein product [Ixodes pacificus]
MYFIFLFMRAFDFRIKKQKSGDHLFVLTVSSSTPTCFPCPSTPIN